MRAEVRGKRNKRAGKPVAAAPSAAASNLTRDTAGAVALLCATVLAYFPVLNGWLIWDDAAHVTKPALRSLHGLWRIWFDLGATQQYYPLLHTAFWVEHRLWGDAVTGYHLLNIVLHATSACLVVAIMRRLRLPGAWTGGFIFALHPVFAEAVAWISEQKSTLSTVFYLFALLTYLRFDEERRRSQYLWSSALFLLALMTKTVTATLPAALLVIIWGMRGKLERKKDVMPLTPWFAVGATAGLFTAWVERNYIGAKGADFALSFAQRVLICGRAIWFYAGKLIWPYRLTFIYPHWSVDASVWWQYLFPLGVAAAAYGLWRLTPRSRVPLAGFLFFIATLFPVLGFLNVFPFTYSYVADHFQYLASLGIIVPAASGFALATKRVPAAARNLVPVAFGLLAISLASLTWVQSGMYQSSGILFRTTLERNPGAWMADNNLGIMLDRIPGRKQEAIAHFESAIRTKPDLAGAHYNLATALSVVPGRLPAAIAEYETALKLDPESAETRGSLCTVLANIPDRLPEAIEVCEAGVRKDPENAKLHYYLANALSKTSQRMPEAIAEYRKALQIDPRLSDARYHLANALMESPDQAVSAVAEYQRALSAQPDDAQTHLNLGVALSEAGGREKQAIAEFETALRLQPDYAEAHYNLGALLSDIPGRSNDAIAEYEAALRDKPDYPEAHTNLGVALSDIPGKSAQAMAEFEAALAENPRLAEAHFGLGQLLAAMPGRKSEAISQFEAVVKLRPDYEPARRALAVLRGGKPDSTH